VALRLAAGLAGLAVVGAGPAPVAATGHRPTTYYVDAAHGHDQAASTSPGAAWRSLDRVDATTFAPGDRVLLHAGQRWTGQLWPKGSGTARRPVTIDRYGRGAKPGIDGAGTVADAVHLHDQQYWDDILVEHCTVRATSFGGIIVKQYTGSDPGTTHTGWGERTSADDPAFTPNTRVVIRDDYIDQQGSAYAANGIYLTDTRGALIERNVIHRAGTSGVEMYYADQVVVQHNEVYQTEQKAGGADSNGIDPDIGTTAYVHDNTVYDDTSDHLVYGYGSNLSATYHLWNNILYSTVPGASLTTSPTIDYTANLYGGAALPVPPSDTRAVVGDPLFAGTVTGPCGTARSGPRLDRALALRPTAGSPAIDAGIPVDPSGGRDYAGVPLYHGPPTSAPSSTPADRPAVAGGRRPGGIIGA
jgi:hypothetical protein